MGYKAQLIHLHNCSKILLLSLFRRDNQPRSSATTLLLPVFTDASVDGRETRSYDGISAYQHAMKILSSEVLSQQEITSTMESSEGSSVMEVQSPVADQTSIIREFDTRSGLSAFICNLKAHLIHLHSCCKLNLGLKFLPLINQLIEKNIILLNFFCLMKFMSYVLILF